MRFILTSKDLTGLVTLSPAGLQARFTITQDDRESAGYLGAHPSHDTQSTTWDNLLASVRDRGPTQVEINPPSFPPEKLLALMQQHQKEAYGDSEEEGEGISLTSPFQSGDVGARWSCRQENTFGGPVAFSQGQKFTLVASHRDKPVGFVVASFRLYQESEPESDGRHLVMFTVDIDMVYVAPAYRHMCFGLDLSLAMSLIVENFFMDLWNALPPGIRLAPGVTSELVSEGGETFVRQVFGTLEAARDMAMMTPDEFSPELECDKVEADFSW